jgi:hypothetical protein
MLENPARSAKVLLYSDGPSISAIPNQLSVYEKSEVTFENLGEGMVTILFQEQSPFPENAYTLDAPGTKGSSLTLVVTGVETITAFTYAIYNNQSGVMVDTNPRPIIIVYPGS